jgi:hypothetical protein
MSETLKLIFDFPPKELLPNKKCHWAVKARVTREARELAGWKAKDLAEQGKDTCWNASCSEYSEKVKGCCKGLLQDGDCEDRYQLSDMGRVLIQSEASHMGREIIKKVEAKYRHYTQEGQYIAAAGVSEVEKELLEYLQQEGI